MNTNKKRTVAIVLQLGLATACGFMFYTYAQKTIDPITTYRYRTTIDDKNYPINPLKDIVEVTIPRDAVTENMVTNLEEVSGKYLDSKVYAGQQVYKDQLVNEGDIDYFDKIDLSKLRKFSIPINYTQAFAGNIQRGDKVDLVFTSEAEGEDTSGEEKAFVYSKTIMQDIPVFSVNTGEGFVFTDHSDKYDSAEMEDLEISEKEYSEGDLGILTLALTLEQSEELEARLSSGKVRVVGRFEESTNYDTLGYVIGDYTKVFTGHANAEVNKTTTN